MTTKRHLTFGSMSDLDGIVLDEQVDHAGHFAVVGEFEARLCSPSNQHFVERQLVLVQDEHAVSVVKLLGEEILAGVAQVVLLKDGGHV